MAASRAAKAFRVASIRGSPVGSRSGGGIAFIDSQRRIERASGSSERNCDRAVVPLRGRPVTNTGRSIGWSSTCGWLSIQSSSLSRSHSRPKIARSAAARARGSRSLAFSDSMNRPRPSSSGGSPKLARLVARRARDFSVSASKAMVMVTNLSEVTSCLDGRSGLGRQLR